MEDLSIPDETVIYISKNKQLTGFAIALGMILLGVYAGVSTNNYWGGAAFMVVPVILSPMLYKRYKNRTPQVIINRSGIETVTAGFFPWEEIGNEQTTSEYKDRSTVYCLEYDCPTGHEEFNIDDLDIKSDDLAYLLSVYRQRSGKKYKYADNEFLKHE